MSTTELRKRVIARVKLTKDAMLLRELDRMLRSAGKEIEPNRTTAVERRLLKRGLEAIKKGRVVPAEKADKAIERWLAK
ncbi:MAG: hypothetical protein IPI81_14605 [Flavobacteriales bacterium]|nr:hypothetical protein [Flavobacteriales bacterium]